MKHAILVSLVFTCFHVIYAQQPSSLNLSFNHLALSVKNLDRSVDFYKRVLDLTEITNKTKVEGIRWFSLGEGKELHLISDAYYKRDTVITNKAIHIALTTNNFEQLIRVFDANKINYLDWPGTEKKINIRPDGVKQIYLQDPDGYWIEINSASGK